MHRKLPRRAIPALTSPLLVALLGILPILPGCTGRYFNPCCPQPAGAPPGTSEPPPHVIALPAGKFVRIRIVNKTSKKVLNQIDYEYSYGIAMSGSPCDELAVGAYTCTMDAPILSNSSGSIPVAGPWSSCGKADPDGYGITISLTLDGEATSRSFTWHDPLFGDPGCQRVTLLIWEPEPGTVEGLFLCGANLDMGDNRTCVR